VHAEQVLRNRIWSAPYLLWYPNPEFLIGFDIFFIWSDPVPDTAPRKKNYLALKKISSIPNASGHFFKQLGFEKFF
jgi:hypothetical protein